MITRSEPKPLPATAPWLLHSLRTTFDAQHHKLQEEAKQACDQQVNGHVKVKFIHRCLEVTALYDRLQGRFTELHACDVGERDWDEPTYCITMQLKKEEE